MRKPSKSRIPLAAGVAFLAAFQLVPVLAPPPVRAQERRPDPLRVAAPRLPRPGAVVRVVRGGAPTVQGRLQSVDPTGLVVREASGGVVTVPLPEVDLLQERRARWDDGLLIGAGVAGGAGLILGLLVAAYPCESGQGCGGGNGSLVIGSTVGLGLVGGLVGALVGSRFHEWRPDG